MRSLEQRMTLVKISLCIFNIKIKLRCISAPRSWSHINNTVVLTILTFPHNQCLHLIYAEVAWVLVSSQTEGVRKSLNLHTLKMCYYFCILLRPLLVMHTQKFDVFGQVIMTQFG